MMSQLDYYMLELFNKMNSVVKQSFLFHCTNENIRFFCHCIFNVVHGQIKMTVSDSPQKLKKYASIIAVLCGKNKRFGRRRQSLASKSGIKLLQLIEPSVLNHLKKRHGLEQ